MPKSRAIVLLLCLVSCGHTNDQNQWKEIGEASYYSNKLHGKKTASGQIYNKNHFTAAHRTLPFGTKLKVTNLSNNKFVVVTINDRGPYAKSRIIDLSLAAAKEIDMIKQGIANVQLEKQPE